jgi:succinate dehydrogenase / fumarate reductase cytochrome b subunit
MRMFRGFLRSTPAQKGLAAASGLVLAGWLFLHLLGNFTALSGAPAMDGYAASLRRLGPLLWIMRAGLLAAVIVHVTATVTLARRARAASPVRAQGHRPRGSFGSRSMIIGGPLLVAFIVYHVLHLTVGAVHPSFSAGHVYSNLISGVAPPLVGAVYLMSAALVGLHLHHGLSSAFVSLGAPRILQRFPRLFSRTVAVLVAVGFAANPLAVVARVLQ